MQVKLFIFKGKVKDLVRATRKLAEIEKAPTDQSKRA